MDLTGKSWPIVVVVAVAVVISGTLGYVVFTATPSSSGPEDYTPQLQKLVTSSWDGYVASQGYSGSEGGVALYVTTPTAAYFASTNISGASPDIHFRAASNTKTFTAAAILLLYQEGKLDLDDNITADIPGTATPYVPSTPDFAIPYKSEITIAELLGQRAGVFDVSNSLIPANASCPYAGKDYIESVEASEPNHQFTFSELVGVDAECHLAYFPPGTGYHYSNTGYSLLGQIIEDVSGLSYAQFLSQYLLAPNGLTNTSVPTLANDTSLPSPYAPSYTVANGTVQNSTLSNRSPHVAEGNIISTPRDLSVWIRNLITGRAGIDGSYLSVMTHACTFMGNASFWRNYCLGVEYVSGVGFGHTGASAGYTSFMFFDPDHNVTVVVFCNIWLPDVLGEFTHLLVPIAVQALATIGDPGAS
jgi:D-alanyl-D-alanine carboxypeptidase